jgi:hypothetical protein
VYKSEIKPFENGAFEWNTFSVLTTQVTTDNNIEQEFKLEFFRNEKSGNHKNIGSIHMSLATIRSGQREY